MGPGDEKVDWVIQIGVVDDHPVFREGLRRSFEREADLAVAWEIGSASELLSSMADRPVEILLIDLNLGAGQDSLASIRTAVDKYPKLKVVVISASLDSDGPAAARAAGAHGYVPKDLSVAELVSAVRRLAVTDPADIVFADFLSQRYAAGKSASAVTSGLTKRQREVLTELRRARTNREIAARLGISVTTVNKHVQQVLQKLKVRNRAQAIALVNAEAAGRAFADLDLGA